MTEAELKQIHRNNLELEGLYWRWEEIRQTAGITSKEITGMPFVGRVFDSSMSDIEDKCDAELKYKELLYKNEQLIRKVRKYIETFPDWILRMILTLHYINGMPLYEVAAAVGEVTERDCEKILKVHFKNVF